MPGATSTVASSSTVTGLSRSTSSRSSTTKPLRLRSACNECHSAKVRCSGEKDGCVRCRNSRLKCEFKVSLVGRATSKRRRISHQNSKNQELQPLAQMEATPSTSPHALTQSMMENDNMGSSNCEIGNPDGQRHEGGNEKVNENSADVVSNEVPQDFQFHMFGGPYNSMPPRNNSLNINTSAHTDFGLPSAALDFTGNHTIPHIHYTEGSSNFNNWLADEQLGDLFPSSSKVLNLPTPPQELLTTSNGTGVPDMSHDKLLTVDFRHIVALVAIVETLETHVQRNRITIDQVVLINRRVMKQLPSIMDKPGYKVCHSCPAVLATILDLVVSLYEMAINPSQPSAVAQDDHHVQQNTNNSDSMSANGQAASPQESMRSGASGPWDEIEDSDRFSARNNPTFKFGCLELEPEEQDILRNQILIRDLRKCIKMIQACRHDFQRLQSVGHMAGVQHYAFRLKTPLVSSGDRLQERWYNELEQKVGNLLSILAKDL